MPLSLEVQFYKQSTTDRNEVIFDQEGDLESYNTHRAWDVLPSHLFREPKHSGGGRVKLEFNSLKDAEKAIPILNGLKQGNG
jgi:hypothetical protein